MKQLWQDILAGLRAALHHVAVKLLIGLLATLGVVQTAEEAVEYLTEEGVQHV